MGGGLTAQSMDSSGRGGGVGSIGGRTQKQEEREGARIKECLFR
jgi:hypothetical protein